MAARLITCLFRPRATRHATRGVVEYKADRRRILAVIKYPLMILSAEVILEELLQKGCLTMVQAWSQKANGKSSALWSRTAKNRQL